MAIFGNEGGAVGGSGGRSSVAALVSGVNATVSGWGTTQDINATATGLTFSIPAVGNGDIAPTLKTLTLRNIGTNPYTIALTGGTLNSALGLVMPPNNIWTFEAITLTTANLIATNAGQGSGQSVSYARARMNPTTATNVTGTTSIAGYTAERMLWNEVTHADATGIISFDAATGAINIKANTVVRIKSHTNRVYGPGFYNPILKDVTLGGSGITLKAVTDVGGGVVGDNLLSANHRQTNIEWVVSPTVDSKYVLELIGGWNSLSSYWNATVFPNVPTATLIDWNWIEIQQLGTTAILNGGSASAKPELPAVGAITKGRPIAFFNNSGIPSVRDCLQGTAGLSLTADLLFTTSSSHAQSSATGSNVGASNMSLITARYNANATSLDVAQRYINANGTVGVTTTSPAGVCTASASAQTMQIACGLTDGRVCITRDNNSSNGYVSGFYAPSNGGAIVAPSSDATLTGVTRLIPVPSLATATFWIVTSNNSSVVSYRRCIVASGGGQTVDAPLSSISFPSIATNASGQHINAFAAERTVTNRDTLIIIGQNSGNIVQLGLGAPFHDNSSSGTGGYATIPNRPSASGALQTCVCANGAGTDTFNAASINSVGQLEMYYVTLNGAPTANAPLLGSAFTIPFFPVSAASNPGYIAICNHDPAITNNNYIPISLVSSSTANFTRTFMLSYTAPATTTTYYAICTYNFQTNTWSQGLTLQTNHPETISNYTQRRVASLSNNVTNPVHIKDLNPNAASNGRVQILTNGSFTVDTNILGIADQTVANGAQCPFNVTGDLITGLSGLVPGQKYWIDSITGAVQSTTDNGLTCYRAITSASAIVAIKF